MGKVLIVTHGPVVPRRPNPGLAVWDIKHPEKPWPNTVPNSGMTLWEIEDINNCIGKLYFNKPPRVICGTGRRHKEMASILGLTISTYSNLVGGAELILPDSQMIFADGDIIEDWMYSCLGDDPALATMMLSVLLKEEKNSIIIADPEFIKNLYAGHPKLATVYQFTPSGVAET